MNDKKLTPRVGDRVIVSAGMGCEGAAYQWIPPCSPKDRHWGTIPTSTGQVVYKTEDFVNVRLDSDPSEMPNARIFHRDRLFVVDREPAEWPEGWSRVGDQIHIHWVRSDGKQTTNVLYPGDLPLVEKFITDGPYIIEHWDELTGDGS